MATSLYDDIAQIALDRPKLQAIVNGSAATTVETDGGTVPSLARLLSTMGAGTVRGAWVTATSYALGEVVTSSGTAYRCAVAHTSAVALATDITAGRWIVHYTATSIVSTMAVLRAAANTYGAVVVEGYTTAGDGGGGLFRWDSASVAADDDGVVIEPTVGGTGRWIRIDVGNVRDVRWFGAKGDDATDNAAAFAAACASLPVGGTLTIPPQIFRTSQVLTIDTENVTVMAYGATIRATVLATEIMHIDSVGGVRVLGPNLIGPETLAAWSGGSGGYRQVFRTGLRFTDSTASLCRDVKVSGMRGAIALTNCYRCKAVDIAHEGFFGPTSSPAADANFSTSVLVFGGRGNQVEVVSAKESGSAVLVQNDGEDHCILNITGDDGHDNGVYISSGFGCTIGGCTFRDYIGAGVKARGSQHLVALCTIRGCGLGISATGNGLTPDADGANGSGTVVSLNTVTGCTTGYGIVVQEQDGLLPRDFHVVNNIVEDHLPTGGFSPIEVAAVKGILVTGNTVRGFLTTSGITVAGTVTDRMYECIVSGNKVTDGSEGIRLFYCDKSQCCNNTFARIGNYGIEARYAEDCLFSLNLGRDAVGGGLRLNGSYLCQDNVVRGNMLTATGDAALNVFEQNDSQPYPNVATDTPRYIGQIAVNGTSVYMSKGTASIADWKLLG